MANSFNFADIYAKTQQDIFLKKSAYAVMASKKEEGSLFKGKAFKKNYSSVGANDVPDVAVRGVDGTVRTISDTAETLTINKEYSIIFEVNDFDEIQSNYGLAMTYGEQHGMIMQSQIDADVLYEVVNAQSTVDAGSVGGTTGQGITLTTSNVLNVVSAATKKLRSLNVYDTDLVGIVSPKFEEILTLYMGAKVTDLGDKVTENGYFAKILGYNLYTSNNLTGSAVLALATNPTAGDTVTIQGQVFTFVSSIGSTAGNVLIGASADATRANFAALINAPGTTTANGVALTGDSLKKFKARAVAVNDDTANTLTVYYKGANEIEVSETLTAADTWTASLKKQLNIFGVRNKMTALVIQAKPKIEVSRIVLQNADAVKNFMLYGVKTFYENAQRMVKVDILTD